MDRIEDGDHIIYDHVSIEGDLNISRLDLPIIHFERPEGADQKAFVVASRIQIRNCELKGDVNFAEAIFQETVDFGGSVFLGEARFKGACFQTTALFEAPQFKRYATFRDARFMGDARFQGACFYAIANFGNSLFQGSASFGSASFSELCTNFGEAIFQGNVDFTSAGFSGTANFQRASFSGPTSFWLAAFGADANFQGSRFEGYASFLSVQFLGNADFRGSRFHDDLNFEFSEFQGHAVFLGACVEGDANFFRSKFKEANFKEVVLAGVAGFVGVVFAAAEFTGARLKGDAHFEESHFAGDALFCRAEFSGRGMFISAQFQGRVDFEQSLFMGQAQFSESAFQMEANFSRAEFKGDVIFNSAHFGSRSLFVGTHFREDARFLGTQFIEAADFTGSSFEKNLLLEGARIYIMRLAESSLKGQISLANADFVRLEARWHVLKDSLVYNGAVCLALVKNFRNMEWFEDADDCYYHYRRKSQSEKRLYNQDSRINWSKILDALALISCGYGIRPGYTVFLSILLIIFFAVLYWAGNGIVIEPIHSSSQQVLQAPQENLTFMDDLYFSSMVFTAKSQVKWYPSGVFRYLATVESVVGWLLMALFLVTLGRTMIR